MATSLVKSAICDSVSGGNGDSRLDDAAITPHSRPPTTIGQPTDERIPSVRASSAIGPEAWEKLSTRTGRPVRLTSAAMLVPSSGMRVPTARGSSSRLQRATPVTVPSASYRSIRARSAPERWPTSRVTASKTSPGAVDWATRVATRRSAACSSASRADARARRRNRAASSPTTTDVSSNASSTSRDRESSTAKLPRGRNR